MKLKRLFPLALLALPCAALLAFGCSEPETIPGGAAPARLSGGPPAGNAGGPVAAAPNNKPAGEPGVDGEPAAVGEPGAGGPAGPAGEPGVKPEGGPGAPPEGGEAGAPPDVPGEANQGGGRGGQQPGDVVNQIEDHPCGDGTCDDAEKSDPKLCPRDCSTDKPAGGDWCGDGNCDARERSLNSCAKDCE